MYDKFRIKPDAKVDLKEIPTDYAGDFRNKLDAETKLQGNIAKMQTLQAKLYAQNQYSVLILLQAMDAAGKDSIIKNVMSGLNPQGTQVYSFKVPSNLELDHDYLWRYFKSLPERGNFGIFNRSYYEEVLVARVHPEVLNRQRVPKKFITKDIWDERFEDINAFEKYLTRNGTVIIKFYLHLSKKEQKERFLERINLDEKNWKFSENDVVERGYWKEYQKAFENVFENTSTELAPWYVVPSDKKWFARAMVSEIIVERLKALDIDFPHIDSDKKLELLRAKDMLENED